MAKWKGTFTVTKIPNRFQIEYLDVSVTRLTHISYAKKYNERCQYTEQVGMPHQTRVGHFKPGVRMACLRLIASSGSRRRRMIVHSMETIQYKWPIHSGRIRVRIIGEARELPADLRAIVEATDQDDCIQGSVLVDLCRQRSSQRGSGCDAPIASIELPTPMVSSPTTSALPAAQVRQYSWHHCATKDVYDIRWEFVGGNRQTNRISPFLPQQVPLVVRAHLLKVVRKVGKSERSRGKHQMDSVFKYLSQSSEKHMTSLFPSCQKLEGGEYPYSVMSKCSNSEMNSFNHVSPHTDTIYTLKNSETRKKEEEVKFKCLGSTNCDVTVGDVIITEANSDVILRDVEVNKPIAGKLYSQQHSFLAKKGFIRSLLSMCSKTFTKMALILAIVISVFGSMFDAKLPERISEIGTSSSLAPSTSHDGLGFLDSSVLSILRKSSATIIGINEGLCSCINRGTFLINNKQLIRRMKVLQNTIMREERGYVYTGYATYALATFARDVCTGKRLGIYIFPSTDFCTFPVYYLDTYTVNLELDDDFTVFYNLIYLYIYNVYRSWASCNWATYPRLF